MGHSQSRTAQLATIPHHKEGGIHNTATLTTDNVLFQSNDAEFGGGLLNDASATMKNVTFRSNNASDSGGGLLNASNLTIVNGDFRGNSAQFGGGIINYIFWKRSLPLQYAP